jgi:alpha-glucosidase
MTQYAAWTRGLHHDGSEVYISNPLPSIDEIVTVKLRVSKDAPINHAFIRAMIDGEFRMVKMERIDEEDDLVQWWGGHLPIEQPRTDYRFKLMTDDGAYFYTAQGISRADSPDFESFIILGGYNAPLWVRDTVYYQIFPERFWNGDPSNDVQDGEYSRMGHQTVKREWGELPHTWEKQGSMDFFGGDLQGITQKLDYLVDLGVNALYLTPIFEADTNHKYDIKDFFTVDKHFGGNEALAELRIETLKRDIKLMLDITPNHCSYKHPWVVNFTEGGNDDTAEFFYYDPKTRSFETWMGVRLLIKLNYYSQKLRDIMYRGENSALKHWLKPPYSIDAWRLDVAQMTGNRGVHQLDHEVWREVHDSVKTFKSDTYLIGEYFQDSTMHTQGDELDAAMNYQGFNMPMRRWLGGEDWAGHDKHPFSDTVLLPTEALAEQWHRFMGAVAYPITLQQFNQLDSHDTTRILHVTDGDKDLVKLGLALMMGFPGVPCIYYGTEIAITGFKDPDNRRCMNWNENDWDTDMLNYTKRLIQLRHQSHALKHGGFEVIHAEGDLVAFIRQSNQQSIMVVGYRGADMSSATRLDMSTTAFDDGTQLVDWLTDAKVTISNRGLVLPPLKHGQTMLLEVQ